MAVTTFDISTLANAYEYIFGYKVPDKSDSIKIEQAAARLEGSSLGQPYYETDLFGREFFMPVKLDGYLIPFAVIGMTWKKTIVKEAMPERGGCVKEIISVDDYEFNIKGLLVSPDNAFPEQGIIDIHNIFKKNNSVQLRSALTAIVLSGTYSERVLITDVKWPPSSGVEHVKAFDITVESDMVYELELR